MQGIKASIEERFWQHVAKSEEGCWEWQGHTNYGYGYLWNGTANSRAHRVSWEIHFGPIPNGLFVCHKCDNRRCVRPDHLFTGTAQDNTDDAKRKNRINNGLRRMMDYARGESHHNAKLTDEKVREIKHLMSQGFGCKKLARAFGVNKTTILNIKNEKIWVHVVYSGVASQ